MSHFTCLVVGNDNLEKYLAPFQEQIENDLSNKEYFVFNSVEEECLEEYNTKMVEVIEENDGFRFSKYADKYRVFDTLTCIVEYLYPQDSKEISIPFKEFYPTFEQFMNEWHGYKSKNFEHNAYGYYKNPNPKWDWWQVGGRWRGFFKAKNLENTYLGKSGVFGNSAIFDADQILKGNIDFDFMKNKAKNDAISLYDKIYNKCKNLPYPKSWKEIVTNVDTISSIDNARDFFNLKEGFNLQEAIVALKEIPELTWYMDFDKFLLGKSWDESRELYIDYCIKTCFIPYAILYNGNWMSRGDMGWFGISSNENADWDEFASNFIQNLPDDIMLTLIDCHI